jgi:hypothetical protein
MGLGSGIGDPEKTYSGSQIQGSKKHRIPATLEQELCGSGTIWTRSQLRCWIGDPAGKGTGNLSYENVLFWQFRSFLIRRKLTFSGLK